MPLTKKRRGKKSAVAFLLDARKNAELAKCMKPFQTFLLEVITFFMLTVAQRKTVVCVVESCTLCNTDTQQNVRRQTGWRRKRNGGEREPKMHEERIFFRFTRSLPHKNSSRNCFPPIFFLLLPIPINASFVQMRRQRTTCRMDIWSEETIG